MDTCRAASLSTASRPIGGSPRADGLDLDYVFNRSSRAIGDMNPSGLAARAVTARRSHGIVRSPVSGLRVSGTHPSKAVIRVAEVDIRIGFFSGRAHHAPCPREPNHCSATRRSRHEGFRRRSRAAFVCPARLCCIADPCGSILHHVPAGMATIPLGRWVPIPTREARSRQRGERRGLVVPYAGEGPTRS